MSLQNTINEHIKKAMFAKEKEKLAALRAVKSAFIVEMAKDGSDSVDDDVAEKIIMKLVKQRKESASIFTEQGREDLAKDEISQMEYLEVYLPEQMSEDELRKVVKEVIEKLGATTPADMGKCMGVLTTSLNGKADGKLISQLVLEELS
ncbi:MAG: glutamyl-tRNA amidotransferase [Flavobacteriales bacterium]|nr:glutamyl-tRNA amidotransferase [Flavobacteriales bacterium]|tara:strand:- start:749 stop:1195 length:447 start_codon:yes stop_codon:yes gene_type:complete